jgi:hypothetical protein
MHRFVMFVSGLLAGCSMLALPQAPTTPSAASAECSESVAAPIVDLLVGSAGVAAGTVEMINLAGGLDHLNTKSQWLAPMALVTATVAIIYGISAGIGFQSAGACAARHGHDLVPPDPMAATPTMAR